MCINTHCLPELSLSVCIPACLFCRCLPVQSLYVYLYVCTAVVMLCLSTVQTDRSNASQTACNGSSTFSAVQLIPHDTKALRNMVAFWILGQAVVINSGLQLIKYQLCPFRCSCCECPGTSSSLSLSLSFDCKLPAVTCDQQVLCMSLMAGLQMVSDHVQLILVFPAAFI